MTVGLLRAAVLAIALAAATAPARAEVFVRWDRGDVPPRRALGIDTLVVPADNAAALKAALGGGYRVYVEVDAARAMAWKPPARGISGVFVRGSTAAAATARLRGVLPSGTTVRVVDERGKWPHIRTNWVTRNKDVLQVTSRSAQPWIENNAALLRIGAIDGGAAVPLISFVWTPITLADADEGPALDNYLVAVAEAGSFGGDLLLPLHARFQAALLLADPRARSDWSAIVRAMAFHDWISPRRYSPVANVAVVVGDPMRVFEPLNLLLRHNVPIRIFTPDRMPPDLSPFDLVIAFDLPPGRAESLDAFARAGGTVMVTPDALGPAAPWGPGAAQPPSGRLVSERGKGRVVAMPAAIADPNAFAMDVRQALGRDRRALDIWNGITVLAAPFEAEGGSVVLSVLNYAAQPLPVQIRVRGTFSDLSFESPDEPATLLRYEHRDGGTEFVLPALRIGARVFMKAKGPQ